MMHEGYTVKVDCANCGRGGTVRIRREAELRQARCPECGTRRLKRVAWLWPWTRRFAKNAQATTA